MLQILQSIMQDPGLMDLLRARSFLIILLRQSGSPLPHNHRTVLMLTNY